MQRPIVPMDVTSGGACGDHSVSRTRKTGFKLSIARNEIEHTLRDLRHRRARRVLKVKQDIHRGSSMSRASTGILSSYFCRR